MTWKPSNFCTCGTGIKNAILDKGGEEDDDTRGAMSTIVSSSWE